MSIEKCEVHSSSRDSESFVLNASRNDEEIRRRNLLEPQDKMNKVSGDEASTDEDISTEEETNEEEKVGTLTSNTSGICFVPTI